MQRRATFLRTSPSLMTPKVWFLSLCGMLFAVPQPCTNQCCVLHQLVAPLNACILFGFSHFSHPHPLTPLLSAVHSLFRPVFAARSPDFFFLPTLSLDPAIKRTSATYSAMTCFPRRWWAVQRVECGAVPRQLRHSRSLCRPLTCLTSAPTMMAREWRVVALWLRANDTRCSNSGRIVLLEHPVRTLPPILN